MCRLIAAAAEEGKKVIKSEIGGGKKMGWEAKLETAH